MKMIDWTPKIDLASRKMYGQVYTGWEVMAAKYRQIADLLVRQIRSGDQPAFRAIAAA